MYQSAKPKTFVFNENEMLHQQPRTRFQDRLTSRRTANATETVEPMIVRSPESDPNFNIVTQEEGQLNVSGGAGDRVVVVTAHLPSTPSRQKDEGKKEERAQPGSTQDAPASKSKRGDLREKIRWIRAEKEKKELERQREEEELSRVASSFQGLRVQISNKPAIQRAVAAVTEPQQAEESAAAMSSRGGLSAPVGYGRGRSSYLQTRFRGNLAASCNNNNVIGDKEDVIMEDLNANRQSEKKAKFKLDQFQWPILTPGASQKKKDPNCICIRDHKFVMCKTCENAVPGRIMRRCPVHSDDTYLMDIACCVIPGCRSEEVQEYDLPASVFNTINQKYQARLNEETKSHAPSA